MMEVTGNQFVRYLLSSGNEPFHIYFIIVCSTAPSYVFLLLYKLLMKVLLAVLCDSSRLHIIVGLHSITISHYATKLSSRLSPSRNSWGKAIELPFRWTSRCASAPILPRIYLAPANDFESEISVPALSLNYNFEQKVGAVTVGWRPVVSIYCPV